jgi:hypothetical protein
MQGMHFIKVNSFNKNKDKEIYHIHIRVFFWANFGHLTAIKRAGESNKGIFENFF